MVLRFRSSNTPGGDLCDYFGVKETRCSLGVHEFGEVYSIPNRTLGFWSALLG